MKHQGFKGGKIIGAGGGGFFMMAVPENVKSYISKIHDLGYRHLNWKFEFNGTHLIEIVQNKIGKGLPNFGVVPYRSGENMYLFANIAKAKRLLNWKPKVSLKSGVISLIDNIDYWAQAPVWDPDSISVATKKWFEYLS